MKKSMIGFAALALAFSTTASAGEITGNGSYTPVHNHLAASICSFSGLNDTPEDIFGFIQAYAVVMKLFRHSARRR